jgi:HPt (histidine-containing phosphotransfer) domain-containing protein
VGKRAIKQQNLRENRGVNPPVFDRDLFETTTMHDAALQVEILSLFSDQLTLLQQKLAVASLSVQECKFLGHTLRGAAAAVGASEIECLAADWEDRVINQSDLQAKLEMATRHFQQATSYYIAH